MHTILMNGKLLAKDIKKRIKICVDSLERKPCLAIIAFGAHPASIFYIEGKRRDCNQCGINSEEYILPIEVKQIELLKIIDTLNRRKDVDSILVQMPLPNHIDKIKIMSSIDPNKDVDCFNPLNMGKIMLNDQSAFLPCTPAAVMYLLDEYNINLTGKRCTIISRSNIIGKPLSMLMVQRGATVVICHSKTNDLTSECLKSDILVTAAGKIGLITKDMVKPGAVVIDVSTNQDSNGNICGDVNDDVSKYTSYITPVPGGVGPVTRAILLKNTIKAALSSSLEY